MPTKNRSTTPLTTAKPPQPSEHDIQCAVFKWARLMCRQYPELRWLFAVPNGGKRHIRVAQKLKAEGVRAGVLDCALLCARGEYIGLWIEHKRPGNKLTEEQKVWKAGLESLGHKCEVSYSFEQSRQIIVEYLESK